MQRLRIAALSGDAIERVVHFGSRHGRWPCAVDEASGTLSLPGAGIEALGLEAGLDLNLFIGEDGRQVHLGPLIGVMLGPADMGQLQQRDRYRCMAHQVKAAGAWPLFFDLQGLQGDDEAAQGWVEQDGQWRKAVMPLPDVIYNRATYGDPDQRQAATRLLRSLVARRRTWLVNAVNAFSKMDVFEALRFFPGTANLAPETLALTGPDDLTDMLSRYSAVFVKGNHGSHGSDVVRLRTEDGMLGIRGRVGSQRVDEHFGEPEQIHAFLQMLRPDAGWVIQQGIDLPTVNERIFDLRVIAQKDGRGTWQTPLILVRLAQQGQVAANMSQGGVPFLPESFLEEYGSQIPGLDGLAEAASDAARRTVLALESRFGLLGEVGIDIGLDRQGCTWVFEANTKPLHPSVPGMEETRLLRYPFEHAVYLAHRTWIGRYTGLLSPVPSHAGKNACP